MAINSSKENRNSFKALSYMENSNVLVSMVIRF